MEPSLILVSKMQKDTKIIMRRCSPDLLSALLATTTLTSLEHAFQISNVKNVCKLIVENVILLILMKMIGKNLSSKKIFSNLCLTVFNNILILVDLCLALDFYSEEIISRNNFSSIELSPEKVSILRKMTR